LCPKQFDGLLKKNSSVAPSWTDSAPALPFQTTKLHHLVRCTTYETFPTSRKQTCLNTYLLWFPTLLRAKKTGFGALRPRHVLLPAVSSPTVSYLTLTRAVDLRSLSDPGRRYMLPPWPSGRCRVNARSHIDAIEAVFRSAGIGLYRSQLALCAVVTTRPSGPALVAAHQDSLAAAFGAELRAQRWSNRNHADPLLSRSHH
jgi:hypothetical protein